MIFVTVGSQKFPFNRLLRMVEELVKENVIKEKVVAQVGQINFKSDYMETHNYLQENEMKQFMDCAEIVITHAGIATITDCVEKKKKVIVVPRRKEYGEHIDNHQLEIVEVYRQKGLITVAHEKDELESLIKNIDTVEFNPYVKAESTLLDTLKTTLKQYV